VSKFETALIINREIAMNEASRSNCGCQVATLVRNSGLVEEQRRGIDGETEIRQSGASNVDRDLMVGFEDQRTLYACKGPGNATQSARSSIKPISVDARIGGMLSSRVTGNLWYLCMKKARRI
jgi:hypothetical protein